MTEETPAIPALNARTAGHLWAHSILLGLLVRLAEEQEGNFKEIARRAFDEVLGRLIDENESVRLELIKLKAREEFMRILELIGDDPVLRRPTLRRKIWNWLKAG